MQHWTESEFKEWVYGLKPEDRHVEQCTACRAEMNRLRAMRERIIEPPEVSQDFLAAQRRNIYRRLHQPRNNRVALRWAVPIAMMLIMVFGLTFQREHRAPAAISDEQLFSDLTAIEQSAEPKAIAPMHKLFEQ